MAAGQKSGFAAELAAGPAVSRNIWQRDNPVEFAKKIIDMPTEADYTVDIQQLVKDDMAKFLASSRGRPAYDAAVFRRPESLPAATRLIKEYLGAGKTEITVLEKMVDYAGDVYDQGVGFAVMSREYPQGELDVNESLYRDVRQVIISFLTAYRPESWHDDNWQAFRRLFNMVLPHRLEPSDLRVALWRLMYGEDTDGWFPNKMPRQKQEAWIRHQLGKMEQLTNQK